MNYTKAQAQALLSFRLLNRCSSWKNLKKYVEQVLRDFGDRYVINFA